MRFYGSCGHVQNTEVSEESFAGWSKPVIHKSVFGDQEVVNEVTQEGDARIVHVYPFRWCCCADCFADFDFGTYTGGPGPDDGQTAAELE